MITEVIRVAGVGTISVTTNDVAAIDIPEDGTIDAVSITIEGQGMTSEDLAQAELSFLSTNQIGSNDARGSIALAQIGTCTITTSGLSSKVFTLFVAIPGGLSVNAGERIHLHTGASTGVTPVASADIYFTGKGSSRRATRRR